MKTHSHIAMGLTAGAFLLIGMLAVAQSPPAGPAASTKAAAATVVPRDTATGQSSGRRQDQFSHASGIAADTSSGGQTDAMSRSSAHATESMQKKHIAGVKYEDRTAAQPNAPSGQTSAKGIQERGLSSAGTAQPSEFAIKENGLPKSKPKPKP